MNQALGRMAMQGGRSPELEMMPVPGAPGMEMEAESVEGATVQQTCPKCRFEFPTQTHEGTEGTATERGESPREWFDRAKRYPLPIGRPQ